ncbi:MAG: hypothetical protein PHD67_10215 [Oscillospiraceae bacterium]|nr:hypothetical protein [Oscillospiraceae bacterium]
MKDIIVYLLGAALLSGFAFLFLVCLGRKKRFIITILLFAIILAYGMFSYGFSGDKNAMVSVPDAVYLNVEGNSTQGEVIYLDLLDSVKTYHIEVSKEYLCGDGYAYFTGNVWDSLCSPMVHVNGVDCKVTTDGGFPATIYHFYIRDIKPREKYRIYVRCGNDNDYIGPTEKPPTH